ncbi:MAG: Gfo/Idh/MocA family oxidoreductase [Pirellulales bacterium]|nr:Gfo/Idh/MocA family oxidoreductase [Pirellulales bacterium]
MSLVKDPTDIRLAMLGMNAGNGHPYSWSAIINGRFEPQPIIDGGYPGIVEYLKPQPAENLGIDGARVTHVWCDNPADAERVARAAGIENVAERPEDVIGQVDAVIIPTDIASEHVHRARPFVDAGVPLLIDKPLAIEEHHLRRFIEWHEAGKHIVSCSSARYAKEIQAARYEAADAVGEIRLIVRTMIKSWEQYGIHAIESVSPLLEPGGWLSVANTGTPDSNIVHVRHASGVDVVLAVVSDMMGGLSNMEIYGTTGSMSIVANDTFNIFKSHLQAFIKYLRTGRPPFAFDETVELMKIIIAGIRSREESGRMVLLKEIDL